MLCHGSNKSFNYLLGICTLCKPWEALVIGAVGAVIALLVDEVVYKVKVIQKLYFGV